MLNEFKNGIIQLTGNQKGKTCTIVACTHGNEIIGYKIIKYLFDNFNIKKNLLKGTLNFVIGNLQGCKEQKRFIDKDFNRIWDFKDEDKYTYEYKRANEIKDILLKSDYVFDLHSTTNPSPFFIIPGKNEDIDMLKGFDVDFIVKDILDFLHGKPLIKYVYENNSKSQTIVMEGYIKDENDVIKGVKNVLYYLNYYGFIDYKNNIENKTIVLNTIKALYAKSMDIEFLFSQNPKSFDKIKKGQQVVKDNGEIIIRDDDYYILMPTKPRYVGEEIGYFLK